MKNSERLFRSFIRMLGATALALVVISGGTYVIARLAEGSIWGRVANYLHKEFAINVDWTVPSWFAVSLWALLGLLAFIHMAVDQPRKIGWLGMTLISWVASVDEFLGLHERLSGPAQVVQESIGIDLAGARWVLLGGVIALLVVLLLIRHVWSLPSEARRDVILGGVVFLIGSIGFEIVDALGFAATDSYNWISMIGSHVEEGLEFAGVILAIRGLLTILPVSIEAIAENPKGSEL